MVSNNIYPHLQDEMHKGTKVSNIITPGHTCPTNFCLLVIPNLPPFAKILDAESSSA